MIRPCDKPCGNKTASGYCATTACINPQYSNIGTAQYGQGVQKRILSIPAADVRPVVLCRDCKHSDTFASDCTEATFPLKCLSIRYGGVYPDWFCEHGEKREES